MGLLKRRSSNSVVMKETKINSKNSFHFQSLQILKHVTQSTKFQRIFWISVILFAFFSIIFSMLKIPSKIVGSKNIPIYFQTFPAVTICPMTKAQKSIINFENAYHDLNINSTNNDYDDEKLSYVEALTQVCDNHLFLHRNIKTEPSSGDEILTNLKKISIPQSNMLLFCQFRNQIVKCGKLFKETLTDDGICHSFNILPNEELFKQVEYRYEENLNVSSQWTRVAGYNVEANINDYPYRALANSNYGLNIVLALKESDIDYVCKGPVSGFKVQLHAPDTFPNMRNGFLSVPLKKDLNVGLNLEVTENEQNCHTSKSKSLKFFQNYSQRNCLTECLSIFTQKLCNCVKISMVRDNSTKICTQHDTECVSKTTDIFFTINRFKENYQCDCKPSCVDLKYHIELSDAEYEFENVFNAFKQSRNDEFEDILMSRLRIYFKNDYYIHTTANNNELEETVLKLSKYGGIFAFFIGASVISVVEIFYFVGNKIFQYIKKN